MTTEVETNAETEVTVAYPKMWKVLLHNDNKTTFEFVIELLETLFDKTNLEAFNITKNVHEKGHGIAGIYTKEVAMQKADEGMMYANRCGYPLVLSYECED